MKEISPQAGFTVVGGQRETLADSLRELWRFRPLIMELVNRDLKIRYKGRVGGILWSLFPPLLQVLTITLMVKFFLSSSSVRDYSAYLMPVMFLWQFFQNTVLDSSQAMLQNAALARKTYFPRAVLPLVTFISNLLHFCISLVFTLAYYFIAPLTDPLAPRIYPANIHAEILMMIPCIIGLGMFALGIGYLLSYLTTLYDDIKFLSITVLGLVLYSLPIFYTIEKVHAHPGIYRFYMLNPLAVWLVGFQRALLPAPVQKGLEPIQMPYDYLLLASFTSFAILFIGFYIFEKSKWMMMERL